MNCFVCGLHLQWSNVEAVVNRWMKELSDQRGEGLYLRIVKRSVVMIEETQRARYFRDDKGGRLCPMSMACAQINPDTSVK